MTQVPAGTEWDDWVAECLVKAPEFLTVGSAVVATKHYNAHDDDAPPATAVILAYIRVVENWLP